MRILIVDDENISRRTLAKKVESLGECTCVDSSKQALELFDKSLEDNAHFDLITLDVSMPHMDGRELLKEIRKKELKLKLPPPKRVKVIMVTAKMNMSTIKECIKLGCNGYLAKPVTRYQLMENLGKLGFEIPEKLMGQDDSSHAQVVAELIQKFYQGGISLPIFPKIAREIPPLFKDRDPTVEELEAVVKKDIFIMAKMISIANSSLYKDMPPVATLRAGLERLGIQTIKTIISRVAVKNLYETKSEPLTAQMEKIWLHSMAAAVIAQGLAKERNMENLDEIFLMGMVHDIGKVLLYSSFVEMSPDHALDDPGLDTAIHEIHTTFGAALLKRLRFPASFVQMAEFHHWEAYSEGIEPELMIISLSDHLADGLGYTSIGDPFELSVDHIKDLSAVKHLGLAPEKVMEITQNSKELIEETRQGF